MKWYETTIEVHGIFLVQAKCSCYSRALQAVFTQKNNNFQDEHRFGRHRLGEGGIFYINGGKVHIITFFSKADRKLGSHKSRHEKIIRKQIEVSAKFCYYTNESEIANGTNQSLLL